MEKDNLPTDDIHLRIRMARTGVSMSQADLASAVGALLGMSFSRALLSAVEVGHRSPNLNELRAIAIATKVPFSWLIEGFDT